MLSDDLLPQPYRLINKVLQDIVSRALDEIGRRLQQGCIVDKKFVPPRTMKPIALPAQRLCEHQRKYEAFVIGAESVLGMHDGTIHVVSSEGDGAVCVSAPLVDGPVAAVDAVSPPIGEPLIAVASANIVKIFASDVHESAPLPASFQPPSVDSSKSKASVYKGLVTRQIAEIPASALEHRSITSLKFAMDGSMLAVGVDGDTSVHVFSVPPPFAALATPASAPAATLILVANAPPPRVLPQTTAESPGPAASVSVPPTRALFAFFSRAESVQLGYYHESSSSSPHRPYALAVAWVGTTTFSKFLVSEFYPTAKERVQEAKSIIAALSQPREQQATVQVTKGGKGADAKGAAAGGKGAQTTQSEPAVAIPAIPPVYFEGRKDVTLPREVVTMVMNDVATQCAIGCLDGVIVVHNGQCVQKIFTATPHRLAQQSLNNVIPISLSFQPSTERLIVGFATQNIPYRCFVDTYDLSYDYYKSLGPDSILEDMSAERKPFKPLTSSSIPFGCLSRMKYLDALVAVVPLGALPFYVVVLESGSFVVDATTGDALFSVVDRSANGSVDMSVRGLVSLPSPIRSSKTVAPHDVGERHAAALRVRTFVTSSFVLLLAPNGDIVRIEAAEIPAIMYPKLELLIGGQVSYQIVTSMNRFFTTVSHDKREADGLAFFSGQSGPSGYPTQGQFNGTTTSSKAQGALSDTRSVKGSKKGVSNPGTPLPPPSKTPTAAMLAGPTQQGASPSSRAKSFEVIVRQHIDEREDEKSLRQERMKGFWDAMKKR